MHDSQTLSDQPSLILYDYWRSTASYRVRIALNLLGRSYESHSVDLLTAQHQTQEYLQLNPQGLVPTLIVNGKTLTQSLAIIEYLHAITNGSELLPASNDDQHRVRQLAYTIAMEIHPVCNLSVATHVQHLVGDDNTKSAWMKHFITKGLSAFEQLLASQPANGFCCGDTPGMADCCLVPQLYNAERWGVDLTAFTHIARVAGAASRLPAFKQAHPDAVKAQMK